MDLWIRQMAERINELEEENKRLKGLLEEQDNKQVLNMTKPQPCTKYRDAATTEWVAKLCEETNEVIQEAVILEDCADEVGTADHAAYGIVDVKKRLATELTDVITLCTSWLDALGYDEEKRGEVQRRVNEKNREREYF